MYDGPRLEGMRSGTPICFDTGSRRAFHMLSRSLQIACYLSEGNWWSQTTGYEYAAFIDYIGRQPDEPLASLVTTNRIINVYGFLVVVMLLSYYIHHCLYCVGNKITTTATTTTSWTLMSVIRERSLNLIDNSHFIVFDRQCAVHYDRKQHISLAIFLDRWSIFNPNTTTKQAPQNIQRQWTVMPKCPGWRCHWDDENFHRNSGRIIGQNDVTMSTGLSISMTTQKLIHLHFVI